MTINVWRIVDGTKLRPIGTDAATMLLQDAWDDANLQANGIITLYMKENLQVPLSKQTLAVVKLQFSKTGPTGQFTTFRQIMCWQCYDLGDISSQITQLRTLFSELTALELTLPENLQTMILCAGLPESLDGVVSTPIHMKSTTDFNLDNMVPMILAEGEQLTDRSLVNRMMSGPSCQFGQKGQKTNKLKAKKPQCEKCHGTGHTTAEHWDNYVKPGSQQQWKAPDSAISNIVRFDADVEEALDWDDDNRSDIRTACWY